MSILPYSSVLIPFNTLTTAIASIHIDFCTTLINRFDVSLTLVYWKEITVYMDYIFPISLGYKFLMYKSGIKKWCKIQRKDLYLFQLLVRIVRKLCVVNDLNFFSTELLFQNAIKRIWRISLFLYNFNKSVHVQKYMLSEPSQERDRSQILHS